MSTGNITKVTSYERKKWPPEVAGNTIYRIPILEYHEQPWYWLCPVCKLRMRGFEAAAIEKAALKHMEFGHKPKENLT